MAEKKSRSRVWVLVDDRAGNTSQSLGVAEALDVPYEIKHVVYNEHVQIPNFFRGASLEGVNVAKSDSLEGDSPDLVIAAGRRLGPVARYIKKRSGKHSKLVQLMWPGWGWKDYDLIAVPNHDKIKKKGENIIRTTTAPHRITPELLAQEAAMWGKSLEHYPAPYLSVLVGGDSKAGNFTVTHARVLGQMVNTLAEEMHASLLVTTSRRTKPEAKAALETPLKATHHIHDPKITKMNPYFAYLALADAIVVTGDSISMCSEACASGKPVFIYAPEGSCGEKQRRLHETLYAKGYAKPFSAELLPPFEAPPQNGLNSTQEIVDAIRQKLGN